MNIRPISLFNYQNNFTSVKRRRDNVDRAATVQDLYEMEDRINAKTSALFVKQNRLIGNALDNIARVAYLTPSELEGGDVDNEFASACKNTRILTHNGKDPLKV